MSRIDKRRKKIIWCISIVTGILIVAVAFASGYQGIMMDEFILLAVMAMIFPPSIANYMDYKWRKSIDQSLPTLFRTIVQAQKTGMTLPQAIEEASKRDYGPLTKELKKINAQISWGMPLEEALQSFAKRVNTPLVQKTVPLIIEANRSGGRVEKVF
ncbi:MAG TPA: type II secretion system F family protein [Candidatus Bathyarchaeota archaeon]|nr:type II secretion system F family protein [Candidatus Bathyarchaeota archaeon]HEX69287.1 type II secretion system F family protein [Candidatus Bathyarchaeota archaeon]